MQDQLVFTLQPRYSPKAFLCTCGYYCPSWNTFVTIVMENFSDELHALVMTILTFTAEAHHATHIVVNHPHSLHILLLRCKFDFINFFLRISGCAKTAKTILPGPLNIRTKMSLLFCNPLPRVALWLCIVGDIIVKNINIKNN